MQDFSSIQWQSCLSNSSASPLYQPVYQTIECSWIPQTSRDLIQFSAFLSDNLQDFMFFWYISLLVLAPSADLFASDSRVFFLPDKRLRHEQYSSLSNQSSVQRTYRITYLLRCIVFCRVQSFSDPLLYHPHFHFFMWCLRCGLGCRVH